MDEKEKQIHEELRKDMGNKATREDGIYTSPSETITLPCLNPSLFRDTDISLFSS